MINRKVLIIVIIILFSPLTNALEVETQCNYQTLERFLLVEKSGHKLPGQKPGIELSDKMREFEILCPWQVETDLNGDKKRDWAGIVSKNGQYSLLAYISNPRSYKIIIVKDFPQFPLETYLGTMTTRELSLISGNKKITNKAKFALVINQIEKPSHAYSWDGKTLAHVFAFEGFY